VLEYFREQVEIGAQKEAEWNEMFAKYKEAFPELGAELERRMAGRLPDNWRSALPKWTPADKPLATRYVDYQMQRIPLVLSAISTDTAIQRIYFVVLRQDDTLS
jgi:transketolase